MGEPRQRHSTADARGDGDSVERYRLSSSGLTTAMAILSELHLRHVRWHHLKVQVTLNACLMTRDSASISTCASVPMSVLY